MICIPVNISELCPGTQLGYLKLAGPSASSLCAWLGGTTAALILGLIFPTSGPAQKAQKPACFRVCRPDYSHKPLCSGTLTLFWGMDILGDEALSGAQNSCLSHTKTAWSPGAGWFCRSSRTGPSSRAAAAQDPGAGTCSPLLSLTPPHGCHGQARSRGALAFFPHLLQGPPIASTHSGRVARVPMAWDVGPAACRTARAGPRLLPSWALTRPAGSLGVKRRSLSLEPPKHCQGPRLMPPGV